MDLNFFRQLLQNPAPIGAVAPLSQKAAVSLTKYARNRSLDFPCKILEAGAGTGNVTQELIPTLQKGDSLDLVEIDKHFCKTLQDKYGGIPGVKIECLSIFDWNPAYKYDYIISTLPLNIFTPEQVLNLFKLYQKLLVSGGVCTYVEYMGLAKLGLFFSQGAAKKRNKERMKMLAEMRNKFLIEQEDIWTNFLPCRVYHLQFQRDPSNP